MKLSKVAVAVSLLALTSAASATSQPVSECANVALSADASGGSFLVGGFCSGTGGADKAVTYSFTFASGSDFRIDGYLPQITNFSVGGLSLTNGVTTVGLNPYFNTHLLGDPNALVRYVPGPAMAFDAGTWTLNVVMSTAVDNSVLGRGFGGQAFITAVPEPETYAMMLAGLGAIGFMARRRKSS